MWYKRVTLFSSIADKHDVFISQLNAFNLEQGIDLSAGVLRVGQEIFIPVQDYQAPTSTPFPDTIKPGTKIDYIVQAGDILESIASEFKTTISAIQEANPGETETLDVGQVLKVPYNVFALTPIIPTATSIPTRAPTPTP
jgi:LysM repeat protein